MTRGMATKSHDKSQELRGQIWTGVNGGNREDERGRDQVVGLGSVLEAWRRWVMFERLGDVCWLKVESFGRKLRHRDGCLLHTKRQLMQSLKREPLLEWQNGQGCKSDVRVFLHFERAKTTFSSRNTQVFDVYDVRILLQRKKFR